MAKAVTSFSSAQPAARRHGAALVAATVLCLAGAGALLWWRQGEAVFAHYLTAALAWCF